MIKVFLYQKTTFRH